MALEWGRYGIRVNAVAPGLIDAGMSEPIYADPPTRAARESKVPLGRLGTAADVADVVLFLASTRAGYVHGQNILVDGGVTGSVIAHLPRPRRRRVDSRGPARVTATVVVLAGGLRPRPRLRRHRRPRSPALFAAPATT